MHVVWHDLGLYLHTNIFLLLLLLRLLHRLLNGKLQNCIANLHLVSVYVYPHIKIR